MRSKKEEKIKAKSQEKKKKNRSKPPRILTAVQDDALIALDSVSFIAVITISFSLPLALSFILLYPSSRLTHVDAECSADVLDEEGVVQHPRGRHGVPQRRYVPHISLITTN